MSKIADRNYYNIDAQPITTSSKTMINKRIYLELVQIYRSSGYTQVGKCTLLFILSNSYTFIDVRTINQTELLITFASQINPNRRTHTTSLATHNFISKLKLTV